ncbi:hypothetical protein HYV80_07250 [Candidatus Woesearchaeota archaeon]|nr:hypothetical protein [Candidatus Woesearchaeota archaeon]
MNKSKPKLYKIIGMCRTCKERFIVDMGQRYASRNYCKSCTAKFNKGGMRNG